MFTICDSQAQIKKGKQYLSKGEYALAIEAFENDLEKAVNRPIALEQLAEIFLNKNYKDSDIKKQLFKSRMAPTYHQKPVPKNKIIPTTDRKSVV